MGLDDKPSSALACLLLKCGLEAPKATTSPPTWDMTYQEWVFLTTGDHYVKTGENWENPLQLISDAFEKEYLDQKGEMWKLTCGTILKWNWSSHLEELPCLSCFWTFKLGQPTHIPWHQEWEFPVDRTDKSEMLPSDHFTWPVNEVQIWNLLKRTYLIFLFYFIKNYDSLFCNTDAIWVFN